MNLNEKQQKQLDIQLAAHQHSNYEVDIYLNENNILKDFAVHANVLRPEIVTSIHLAKWLLNHDDLYLKKDVLDMGSGTGIQGIVMGLYGAEKVTFSDLSFSAVDNTKVNVIKYDLEDISKLFQGDLFENIKRQYDLIVFNHPFFPDHLIDKPLDPKYMVDKGPLIHRFLEDAKEHLTSDAKIIMPYFHLAGPTNNPEIQAPLHDYKVHERYSTIAKTGLQKGKISFYELKLNK